MHEGGWARKSDVRVCILSVCVSLSFVCVVCFLCGSVYLSLCVREYMNVRKSVLGTVVYVSVFACVSRQEHAKVCRATV